MTTTRGFECAFKEYSFSSISLLHSVFCRNGETRKFGATDFDHNQAQSAFPTALSRTRDRSAYSLSSRAIPSSPVSPVASHASPSYDASSLRHAFASFATGITVITTLDTQGTPVGLTANSFGSVSLDPPLVQWNLRINSGLHRSFVDAPMFCVSVLSKEQETIARQFSSRAPDRFTDVELVETAHEPPLIAHAIAHFVCRKVNDYRIGDHELFVGEVLRVKTFPGEPLVFHASKFRSLSS
jgi:flavin reductase (DIM6/NTAB) family NADH-FMN oxidoreductase RutF